MGRRLFAMPLYLFTNMEVTMKCVFTMFFFLLIAFGCSENEVNNPLEDDRQPFVIHPLEYSKNHFVLDKVYLDTKLNIYQNYFGNYIPYVSHSYYIVKKIELWKTTRGNSGPEERRGFIDGHQVRIIPLIEGKDFLFNKYVGMVSLINPLESSQYLAAAYKIEGESISDNDDIQFGTFKTESSYEISSLTALSSPNYSTGLQLKNIYSIGNKNISSKDFTFDIYFILEANKPKNNYQNIRLLKAFGFDFNDDGIFDFEDGKTILSQTGEIIFPSIEPFGDNLPEILFKRQGDTLVSPYQVKSIYTNSPIYAERDSNASKYYFYGKYYTK